MATQRVDKSVAALQRECGTNPSILDEVPNDNLDPCIPVVLLVVIDVIDEGLIQYSYIPSVEEFQKIELQTDVVVLNIFSNVRSQVVL